MRNKALTKQLQDRNYATGYVIPLDVATLIRECGKNGNASKLSITTNLHPRFIDRLERHLVNRLRDSTLSLATLHNLIMYINSIKGNWVIYISGTSWCFGDSSFVYYSKQMPKEYTQERNLVSLYDVINRDSSCSLQIEIKPYAKMITDHVHHAYRYNGETIWGHPQTAYRDDQYIIGHHGLTHFFSRWHQYAMSMR